MPIGVSNEHNSWVVNVCVQAGGAHEIVSGSVSGDIRFWDVRSGRSFKQLEAHKNPMTALTLHKFAPILATGTHNQCIRTFSTVTLDPINEIKYIILSQHTSRIPSIGYNQFSFSYYTNIGSAASHRNTFF